MCDLVKKLDTAILSSKLNIFIMKTEIHLLIECARLAEVEMCFKE